jgi:hypothetical protein
MFFEGAEVGIYVVGMHRSGTSALSRAVGIMVGYNGQAEAKRGNPSGHWENPDMRRGLDQMMRSMGADWSAPPPAPVSWDDPLARPHKAAIGQIVAGLGDTQWVLKDPRLCVALDAVLAIPQAPATVVNIYRHPVEVADSIHARDGLPFMYGLALWEAYVRLQLLQGAAASSVTWVAQDDLLTRSAATLEGIADSLRSAGIAVTDDAVHAAGASIDPELRHAASGGSDARVRLLSDQQCKLLDVVQRRADGADANGLPEMTPWAEAMIELRRPFNELSIQHHVLSRRMRRVKWAFSTYDWVRGRRRQPGRVVRPEPGLH